MKSLGELIFEFGDIDPQAADYVAKYEQTLAEIFALHDPSSITALLPFFDDNAAYEELVYSIIHGIESFEIGVFVRQMLHGIVEFNAKAPHWASTMFMRILNNENTRYELIRQLHDVDKNTRDAVTSLMHKISIQNVKFLPKTTAVLAAAS